MDPLDITFTTLASCGHSAAEELLLSALDARERALADRAVTAILTRKSPRLLRALLERWPMLPQRWRQQMAACYGIFEPLLGEWFSRREPASCQLAAEAALELGEAGMIEFFISQVEDKNHPSRKLAAVTVVGLAEKLHEELHAPRRYGLRRDPERLAQRALDTLAIATSRFREHFASEIVEAFLVLAGRDHVFLREVFYDSTHPAFRPICEQFTRSSRDGVMHLLLALLDDPHPLTAGLRLIGQRRDVPFLRALARKLNSATSKVVASNLARIQEVVWLDDAVALVSSLGEQEQIGMVQFCTHARLEREKVIRLLRYLFEQGQPRAQHAAVRSWIALAPSDLPELLRTFLTHTQPLVRAEAVRNLRRCEYPQAVSVVVQALHDPDEGVQAAARESLEEFSFRNYLEHFDSLTPEARHASGIMVKRVNPDLVPLLEHELGTRHRAQRLRGLAMAEALDMIPQLEEALLKLVDEEDHAVQLEAIRLLGRCSSSRVGEKLAQLATMHDLAVQHVAEETLAEFAHLRSATNSTPRPETRSGHEVAR